MPPNQPQPSTRKHKILLGVDPGVGGGLARICEERGVDLTSMPETDKDIWQWIHFYAGSPGSVLAILEQINPGFPGTSKTSMAKLYGHYRSLRMALAAAGIRTEEVLARKWQAKLDITPRKPGETDTKWKNRLKARCQQLYPHEHVTLKTCDALLLCEYGKLVYG